MFYKALTGKSSFGYAYQMERLTRYENILDMTLTQVRARSRSGSQSRSRSGSQPGSRRGSGSPQPGRSRRGSQ